MAFVIFATLVVGAVACWVMLRKTRSEDYLKLALVLATTTTVLFAPHYSWYFAWLVPFLGFAPSAAVFYLTTASFLLYLSWLGDSREEMFFTNSLIYLPFFFIGVIEFFWRRSGFNFLFFNRLAVEKRDCQFAQRPE